MFDPFDIFRRNRTSNQLYIQPPKAREDRSGIAIAAVVKNEAAIMREWLLHNLNIGVSHFILYDNHSSDDTISVARETLSDEALTVIPWVMNASISKSDMHLHQQCLAFVHAIETFGDRFERIAFVDPDEFIIPRNHLLLSKAIADAGNPPNIALPWHMFGRNGHMTPPEGGVGVNYLKRFRDIRSDYHMAKFKCIVDPCEVVQVGVHVFATVSEGNTCANDVGVRVSNKKRFVPSFISAEAIQLNHYFTRSDQELKAKITRSSNQAMAHATYERRVMKRVIKMERDAIEDRALLDLRARAPELVWV
jgi:hypothetical protein